MLSLKATMGKLSVLLLVAALGVKGVAAAYGEHNPDLKWVQMHGWLMWAAMGLLFPLGTILIRYNRPQRDLNKTISPGRVLLSFYLHAFVQCIAVVAAIGGVAILINRIGTNWNYTHQRLGLALLIIVMLQPWIGLIRPTKGTPVRAYWFVIHWGLGTGGLILGIVNCYIGINAYQKINNLNIRSLNIAFSIQIALMGLWYFLQDRWSYIIRQGATSDSSQLPVKAGPHQIGMSL